VFFAAALALAVGDAGCARTPPRFADRPVVWEVSDDAQSAVPHVRPFLSALHYSDIYVRRAAVNLLEPRRASEAADINAYDEVPRSSWFEPKRMGLEGYRVSGPPQHPLRPSEQMAVSRVPGARVVTDARGLLYELASDEPDRPEMSTAASAIASRLLYSLGYRTPEVWITVDERGRRVAATRWPVGIDLGATSGGQPTRDDANDVVHHADRRTLRGAGMVSAWIALHKLRPGMLRDVYVGQPGRGHVQHYVVGLEGALGVAALRGLERSTDPDAPNASPLYSLITLGLSPKPEASEPSVRWPAVGHFGAHVDASRFAPSPPFEPLDRVRDEDLYWIAKRIASVPDAVVRTSVEAGQISDESARDWMSKTLLERRRAVVAHGFAVTTPCDFVALRGEPATIALVDRAIEHGFARSESTVYAVELLDHEGDSLAEPNSVRADRKGHLSVAMPSLAFDGEPYVIMSVTAFRGGRSSPRPVEVHVISGDGSPRVVGVRH